MSVDEIANAFITHYYTTLDSNPSALGSLYQPQSTLTIEGNKVEGADQIVQKYVSLGPLQHNIQTLTKDVQIGQSNTCLLIFVTGHVKIGTNNPLHFSQMFQLVALGPGQYYVHNEMFRLIYG